MARKTMLDEALKTMEKMDGAAERWAVEVAQKRQVLAELESSMGGEALADAGKAEQLAEDLAVVRARVDVAESTHGRAAAEAVEARRQALRAYGAELLAEAAKVRSEAETRQKRTERLLAELAEYEGVDYAPKPIMSVTGVGSPYTPVTRTGGLLNKAAHLEREAEQWRLRADEAPDAVARWVEHLLAKLAETDLAAA